VAIPESLFYEETIDISWAYFTSKTYYHFIEKDEDFGLERNLIRRVFLSLRIEKWIPL